MTTTIITTTTITVAIMLLLTTHPLTYLDPGKHLLEKPQYQVDKHYDDNDNYSDNYDVSRHPHLLPALLSEATLRPMPRIAQRPEPREARPPSRLSQCGLPIALQPQTSENSVWAKLAEFPFHALR